MTSWFTSIQSAMSDLMAGKSYYRRTVRGNTPLRPEASICYDKGLSNAPGANNCFLNAAVQVLWHIDVFRRSFRSFETHVCVGPSCIFCALKILLTQFQHSELPTLPPDVLRQAMAVCYESKHRFKIGCMDDAAECLEKILEQIHFHLTGNENLDSCIRESCISHQKFALSIVEMTICDRCQATSEPLSFIQFIHYIPSSALVAESVGRNTISFGALIKESSYERRECSNVECKRALPLKKILLNCPDVVCIGMIWDTDQPSVEYITKVLDNIGTTLKTVDAFDTYNPTSSRVVYQLKAIVAYYGKHYASYCYHSHIGHWVYFDDAIVKDLGPDWASASRHCLKAHYQPLLLVYVNPLGQPISGTLHPAPSTGTPVGEAQEPPTGASSNTAGSNVGSSSGPSAGPSAASNAGSGTSSSVGPHPGSGMGPSAASNTGPSTSSSSELSQEKKPGPPNGGSSTPSLGRNGSGGRGEGGASNRGGGGGAGSDHSRGSSVGGEIGRPSAPSNGQSSRPAATPQDLPKQQEGAATGRWSPSMERKRPAAQHLPPGEHVQSPPGEHLQSPPGECAQSPPPLQQQNVPPYHHNSPDNLMEFSMSPQQLGDMGRGGGGGVGGKEMERQEETRRRNGEGVIGGGGGKLLDPMPLNQATHFSIPPSQCDDLITFSMMPATTRAPVPTRPQTTPTYPTGGVSQHQSAVDVRRGSAVGAPHPTAGYVISKTGSTAGASGDGNVMMHSQTGQIRPQQLLQADTTPSQPFILGTTQPSHYYGPGATPSQYYTPGATPSQYYTPGATPSQYSSPGTTPSQYYGPGVTPSQYYGPGVTLSQYSSPGTTPSQYYGPGGPGVTPSQYSSPGTTPSPNFFPTQPFINGSTLAHLNVPIQHAVTQPSGSTGLPPSSAKPVRQDPSARTPQPYAPAASQPHMFDTRRASQTPQPPQQEKSGPLTSATPKAMTPATMTPTAMTPATMTPTTMTPTAMMPATMTPTAMTPTAMTPTAMTPTAMTPAATSASVAPPCVPSAQVAPLPSRVPSGGQYASSNGPRPPPAEQISSDLIEALPERVKVDVFEALDARATAEALIGYDDVTSQLLYRQAATKLSNLQFNADVQRSDRLKAQLDDCRESISRWLSAQHQVSCDGKEVAMRDTCKLCGHMKNHDRALCGPCRLNAKKSGGDVYV